jgi:hypothetical protein
MQSALTQRFIRARVQASFEMQFTNSLSCDAEQRNLVLSKSFQHIETTFKDKTNQVDSR